MTIKNILSGLVVAAAGFMFAQSAQAGLITGDLSFNGGYIPNTTPVEDATSIDFTLGSDADDGVADGDGVFRAGSCSGSFASFIACNPITGDIGTIMDFTFDVFTPTIANFWTIGGFSFELESITLIDRSVSDALTVKGLGTITGNGFDQTGGTFLLTANESGSTFTYSASSGVPVPEPTTMALLGLGLAGLGVAARRRKAA